MQRILIFSLSITLLSATDDFDADFDNSVSDTAKNWFAGHYLSARDTLEGPDIKRFPEPLVNTGCNFYLLNGHKVIAYRGGCKNGLAEGQGEYWAKRFGKRYYLAGNFVAGKAQGLFLRIDEKPWRRSFTTWTDGFETGPAEIWYEDGWHFTGNLTEGLRSGEGRQRKWFEKYSQRIDFYGIFQRDAVQSGELITQSLGRQRVNPPETDFSAALAKLTASADRKLASSKEDNPADMTITGNHYRQRGLEGKFLDASPPLTYIQVHGKKQSSSCKVRTSATVHSYRGECKNGFAHGFGELWGKNKRGGFHFVGNFANGVEHGVGAYADEGLLRYVADFVEGVENGRASIWYPDGVFFHGKLKNGLKDGEGWERARDGAVFKGHYEKDAWKKGRISFPDKSWVEVENRARSGEKPQLVVIKSSEDGKPPRPVANNSTKWTPPAATTFGRGAADSWLNRPYTDPNRPAGSSYNSSGQRCTLGGTCH